MLLNNDTCKLKFFFSEITQLFMVGYTLFPCDRFTEWITASSFLATVNRYDNMSSNKCYVLSLILHFLMKTLSFDFRRSMLQRRRRNPNLLLNYWLIQQGSFPRKRSTSDSSKEADTCPWRSPHRVSFYWEIYSQQKLKYLLSPMPHRADPPRTAALEPLLLSRVQVLRQWR